MTFDALPGNLARVRETIAGIQAREGLAGDVRIVAVTKGHPPLAVQAACAAGLLDVGENRVQEALRKQEELATVPVRWHLIGHLQTNKAKLVPNRFAMVQSVDSERVARALEQAMGRLAPDARLPVLLQVNVAGETQKSGCDPVMASELAGRIGASAHLRLEGLMTMAPFTDDERRQRAVFGKLRGLREALSGEGWRLPALSMGMSGDFPAAVAEGATILRLGTVLFGERPQ